MKWYWYGKIDGVCMKVGTAYSAECVNKLYYQYKKHHDGTFTCYTDDQNGIDDNIRCVSINPVHKERMWWNKALLFQPGLFKDYPTVFFDLDSIIHGPTTHIVQQSSEHKPNFLKTAWFSDDMANIIHNCTVNSSVMVLYKNNFSVLWDEYKNNTEKLFKSFYGIDGWIHRRHINNINFIKPGLVYSLKYGSQYPDDNEQNKLRPDHVVCVLDNVEDKEAQLDKLWKEFA